MSEQVNGAFLFCFFPLTSLLSSVLFGAVIQGEWLGWRSEEEGGEEAHSHFGPASLACRRVAERGLFPLLCAKAELCAQNEMASSLALSRPSLGWRSEGARPCSVVVPRNNSNIWTPCPYIIAAPSPTADQGESSAVAAAAVALCPTQFSISGS